MNATITLREYLEKEKSFVIPNYQRGYVWGKNKAGDTKNAVEYILEDSLIPGFKNHSQIFVQGITVTEKDKEIVLIDGQQRTTFFYLLLKALGYTESFTIKYDIRKESDDFLSTLTPNTDISENQDEDFQDIYFFKKTLRIVSEKLEGLLKDDFLGYILDNVKFLYIDIPEDKATKVFSMMNGSKALMKDEELIKAEVLRLASLNDSSFEKKSDHEKNAVEWDNNMLRSRYAREWDKWLQWWNRDDVKKLYKHSNVMGYLIKTYLYEKEKKELTFSVFKNSLLFNQKPIEAKQTFDGLRRMQKRFEDTFKNPITYNKVGAIIRISKDRETFIQWYFSGDKKSDDELDKYYKWTFIGSTHKEICEDNQDQFEKRYNEIFKVLSSNNLYNENAEEAFRLLLRLNIDEDNLQDEGKGRIFDFSIWDRNDSRGRSLEHIYPKSKVLHKEIIDGVKTILNGSGDTLLQLPSKDEGCIARVSCKKYLKTGERITASEHSIGNLVLLYKDDNSAFNDSSFEDKKNMFFKRPDASKESKEAKAIFKSRHLLHTIYKFSSSSWTGREIAENKYQTLEDFRKYYGK